MRISPWTVGFMGILIFCVGCKAPEIGLTPAGLLPCPDSPNCVTSQAKTGKQAVRPLIYSTDKETAYAKIKQIVANQENATIVAETNEYLHVEFRSKFMGFVDDMEFWFPEDQPVIHLRSASRLGHSDFGVNGKRVQHIRALFEK
ncbi:MAG: DUF1499 domain-containing protein [Desulfobacterium sp.]